VLNTLSSFVFLISSLAVGNFILPFFVLWLVNFFSHHKFLTKRIAVTFLASIFLLTICTNLFWEAYVRGVVYYEWDDIVAGHSMIVYDSPVIEGTGFFDTGIGQTDPTDPRRGSWFKRGWSHFGLYVVWVSLTVGVYMVNFASMWLIHKEELIKRKAVKSFGCAFLVLCVFTVIIGLFNNFITPIVFFLSAVPLFYVMRILEFFSVTGVVMGEF
jgi:hypothetical protein